ncbi:unnamed protein product [Cyclocybe aegerita]|uniref:N-acetyltransferase domain-containing protein n=1 Tax=Cyclocybe aegerita TaxID=1973307 RepID=A0A8S0W4P1_CYCAE|nr:unnamed protein product [Cyclocybe aegerita]
MTTPTDKPYVRAATPKEIEEIVQVAARAFVHDPIVNYLGNAPKLVDPEVDLKEWKGRQIFHYFLIKATFLIGRVMVAVDPAENGKIIAGALWMPPRTRLSIWRTSTLLRARVIPLLKQWKLTGLLRMAAEYPEAAEKMLKTCFEAKGSKESPHKVWYLQMIFTDPDRQGRGLMSMLMREAFDYAPESVFCLEATTEKSRDRYTHLGFEHPTPIILGVGKVDKDGVQAQGENATGFVSYAMGRWPSK